MRRIVEANRTGLEMIARVLIRGVGAVFLASAALKAWGPCGCASAVGDIARQMRLEPPFPIGFALCTLLIGGEAALGGGLLLLEEPRGHAAVTASLVVVFSGVALLVRGPCGCFGGIGGESVPLTLGRNMIIWSALMMYLATSRARTHAH